MVQSVSAVHALPEMPGPSMGGGIMPLSAPPPSEATIASVVLASVGPASGLGVPGLLLLLLHAVTRSAPVPKQASKWLRVPWIILKSLRSVYGDATVMPR
jgi:hypothetical protein